MRVLIINSVPYGSIGKIIVGITECATFHADIEIQTAFGFSTHPLKSLPYNYIKIGNFFDKSLHIALSRITGFHGLFSSFVTYNLIRKIKKFSPDIIHIHNLHGPYLNFYILFKYISDRKIKTIVTLHDCWMFTGHCVYFDMVGCQKWKTKCHHCPSYKSYPKSLFDTSEMMYKIKKQLFEGMNMHIVTPSKWLEGLVKQSFLSNHPCHVINNGIDLNVFKPTNNAFKNQFRQKYIILGVAMGWDERKGIDVFIDLSSKLSEDFQIVLVGVTPKLLNELPSTIYSINKTQDAAELADIYSSADVFVNPTREDNFPTVNIEAIACGTPVITFATGGSPEIIDETCGVVVPQNDTYSLLEAIVNLRNNPLDRGKCRIRAMQYDMNTKFNDYIELYRSV